MNGTINTSARVKERAAMEPLLLMIYVKAIFLDEARVLKSVIQDGYCAEAQCKTGQT